MLLENASFTAGRLEELPCQERSCRHVTAPRYINTFFHKLLLHLDPHLPKIHTYSALKFPPSVCPPFLFISFYNWPVSARAVRTPTANGSGYGQDQCIISPSNQRKDGGLLKDWSLFCRLRSSDVIPTFLCVSLSRVLPEMSCVFSRAMSIVMSNAIFKHNRPARYSIKYPSRIRAKGMDLFVSSSLARPFPLPV